MVKKITNLKNLIQTNPFSLLWGRGVVNCRVQMTHLLYLLVCILLVSPVKATAGGRVVEPDSVRNATPEPLKINLWRNEDSVSVSLPQLTFIDNGDPLDTAFVYIYHVPQDINTGRAIVVCPGGGYTHLSMENEGTKWARYYQAQGITAVLLKYRMPHANRSVPISDAEAAIRLVRANAEEWGIKDVGIMGFSAGGHLASTIATRSQEEARPDFQVLLYPVISMLDGVTHKGSQENLLGENALDSLKQEYSSHLNVTPETPRAFICLANDDRGVIPENGVSYYLALNRNKVSASLHIYPQGGHGFGFRTAFANHKEMLDELSSWLRSF